MSSAKAKSKIWRGVSDQGDEEIIDASDDGSKAQGSKNITDSIEDSSNQDSSGFSNNLTEGKQHHKFAEDKKKITSIHNYQIAVHNRSKKEKSTFMMIREHLQKQYAHMGLGKMMEKLRICEELSYDIGMISHIS